VRSRRAGPLSDWFERRGVRHHDHLMLSGQKGVISDVTAGTADPVEENWSGRRAAVGVPVPGGRQGLHASTAWRVCFRAGRGGGAGARARAAATGAARLEIADPRGTGEAYLEQHDVDPVTIEKLRWLLGKAVAVFGNRPIGELRSQEIAAWRIALSPGYRFDATQGRIRAPSNERNTSSPTIAIDCNPGLHKCSIRGAPGAVATLGRSRETRAREAR